MRFIFVYVEILKNERLLPAILRKEPFHDDAGIDNQFGEALTARAPGPRGLSRGVSFYIVGSPCTSTSWG